MDLKPGDTVRIIRGPLDKVGLIGTVKSVIENGVFVELGPNWFTPIQFINLEKIERRD